VPSGRPRRLPSRGTAATFGARAGFLSLLGGVAFCRFGFGVGVGVAVCRVERAAGACLAVLAAGLYVGGGEPAGLVGAGATTVFGGAESAFGAAGVVRVVCALTGASGVGVADAVPAARVARASSVAAFTGASAIRGAASLRGPDGGSSGVGADAP